MSAPITMANILDQIVATKEEEVSTLTDFEFFVQETKGLKETKGFLHELENQQGPAIIAEIKKASPSKGIICENFEPLEIAKEYQAGGATCLSVLTDKQYFQGNIKDLQVVASKVELPCIRKDFIIDKRQIVKSRIAGADCILLIAAILDDHKLKRFHNLALDLGMDVLVEVHDEEEMERALAIRAKLIGINNRNLKTFDVDLKTTTKLVDKYKNDLDNKTIVAESGISSAAEIQELYTQGVKAFLVGESIVKQDDRTAALQSLLQ